MAACLIMRLPGLMNLPIFGDEAIYLRWAQWVWGSGSSEMHPWVSLADPKPPLHFWLLSLVIGWGSDPLLPARLLSVFAGAASILLVLATAGELAELLKAGPGQSGEQAKSAGRGIGLIAALLAIFCPFLAFYQRLATADAVFVAESLAIVWLSLRWGRLAAAGKAGSNRAAWSSAAGLGVAIGAALLTRQGVSYTLCIMPVAGLGVCAIFRRPVDAAPRRSRWIWAAMQLSAAAVIAAVLWSPYLLAHLPQALASAPEGAAGGSRTTLVVKEIKRRIFYQDQFTAGGDTVLAVARRNAGLMFWPHWNAAGEPDSGWFYLYLTPVVYILCLAGVVYTAIRQSRLFLILAIWAAAVLLPMIFLAHVIYSRYVLAGVMPMLFAGAYLLADLLRITSQAFSGQSAGAWAMPLAILVAMLSWPTKELMAQATFWKDQTLTARDRYQYITGWTDGYGSRDAIAYLRKAARAGPLVVITDDGWGTPSDAVWAELVNEPQVHLFYADDLAELRPESDTGELTLRRDKWLFEPAQAVKLADIARGPGVDRAPVLVITQEVYRRPGEPDSETADELPRLNPNLGPPITFKGVPIGGNSAGEGVVIFPLRWGKEAHAETQP